MKSSAVVETLQIAKHDERGRRIADAQEKEALMAAYAASGMTQRTSPPQSPRGLRPPRPRRASPKPLRRLRRRHMRFCLEGSRAD